MALPPRTTAADADADAAYTAPAPSQRPHVPNQLFLGTFVHSLTRDELEYLHDGAVCVEGRTGKIVAVGRFKERTRAEAELFAKLGWDGADVTVVESGKGGFFFPGFIDTHIHAAQYPNAGIFGNSTLLDWLDKYTFPAEASMTDLAKARTVYRQVVRRTLAHGTTCAAYFATRDVASTNLLADLCLAAGQRALVGRVCMDSAWPDYYRDEDAATAVADARASVAHIDRVDPPDGSGQGLVRPVLTPRFAASCSADLLRGLGDLAAEGARDPARAKQGGGFALQTHVGENLDEIALVRSMFPPETLPRRGGEGGADGQAEWSYTGVYDAFGLLTPRTILAHAVHVTDAEVALMAARGAKVSHCPCSNGALGSGMARVRRLLDADVGCGLGTDVSGGYSASMLEAARQAAVVSRLVAAADEEAKAGVGADTDERSGDDRAKAMLSVDEVLWLATRGGADLVGLADEVGWFGVGMSWDAQLVRLGRGDAAPGSDGGVDGGADGGAEGRRPEEEDVGNVDLFGWESWEERVAKWVYCGDDRNTKKVWVKGRLVHARR